MFDLVIPVIQIVWWRAFLNLAVLLNIFHKTYMFFITHLKNNLEEQKYLLLFYTNFRNLVNEIIT